MNTETIYAHCLLKDADVIGNKTTNSISLGINYTKYATLFMKVKHIFSIPILIMSPNSFIIYPIYSINLHLLMNHHFFSNSQLLYLSVAGSSISNVHLPRDTTAAKRLITILNALVLQASQIRPILLKSASV